MANYTKKVIANLSTFIGMGFSKWTYDYYVKLKDTIYMGKVKKDYLEYMNGVGHL